MFKTKTKVSILISIFLFVQIFGVFFLIRPVSAAGLPVIDVPLNTLMAKEQITDNIEKSALSAALGSLVSGASYFMRKLAYDSAKYLASGGKGQSALVFEKGFGNYLTDELGNAASTAIDSFGKPFGLNLCSPPDISSQLNIQISLSKIYDDLNGVTAPKAGLSGSSNASGSGPQTNCKWSDFKKNWGSLDEDLNNIGIDNISEKFTMSLNATQGDFGVALGALMKVDRLVAAQKEASINERLEGEGFKSLVSLISGDIKTPAALLQEEGKALTGKNQGELSANQIAGLYGSSAWQIIPSALSVFANTFVSSLLERIMTKGILPENGGDALNFAASTLNGNRQAAERAFSFLITGLPQRSLKSYDIITHYSSCPANPSLNNCVMDGQLVQALNRSNNDPITIKEALDAGLLYGNWKLIPPDDLVNNVSKECYENAYCYSNIQKMRKARILPLGFEIAALKSPVDDPYTLQEVVNGYYDCNKDFTPDPAYPFCHLIDPNWILKVEEARCEAEVNGPLLATENTSLRATECVDFSTCLAKDSNGSCLAFGYCTKEKNVWEMPGKSCPAEFNTCKTYTSTSGAINSYLSRTIDVGSCNIDAVGCTAYSTEKVNNNWLTDLSINNSQKYQGIEQTLYFNSAIDNYTCPETENGCTLFIYPTTTQDVYLKKAPDYLGCYDTNKNTSEVDWPNTKLDLLALQNNPAECNNFASVCIPEEVGCNEYVAKNDSTKITGVIGNNFCPSSCIGYETFKQEKTNFEEARFPLYFIPAQGQSCSPQYAGCDEFTNLSNTSGEQLEYYTDLKYCQKPENDNAKTFYSWEGSDTQGYVLKKHNLLQIDNEAQSYLLGLTLSSVVDAEIAALGSPAYVNDSTASLQENYDYCNVTNYDILIRNPYNPDAANSDCRALYDDDGKTFYRLLAETVTVSDSCYPLRKTVSNFYTENLTENTCLAKDGKWNGSSCDRCMDGGIYELGINGQGYCKYWSIQSEAQSCPAVVNGCRLYIGNTGNNVHNIYQSSFEPTSDSATALVDAKEFWGNSATDNNVSVELEATQVGLHSLKVSNGNTKLNLDNKVKKNTWYELHFWAKAVDVQTVNINFGNSTQNGSFTVDNLTGSSVPVSIGNEWQEYQLGPVQFVGDENADFISFVSSNNKTYFIDNVRVLSLGDNPSDYIPLIKDSWKTAEGYDVSTTCDSSPLDPYPGEYLGCKEYTAKNNQIVSITGFQNLCRAEAVGCVGLVDTGNVRPELYLETKYLVHNALCLKATANSSNVCGFDKNEDGEKDYTCELEVGDSSCYIEGPIEISRALPVMTADVVSLGTDMVYTDNSTVVTPISSLEDTELSYLTVNDKTLCSKEYLGCQEVGMQRQELPDETAISSYSFSSKFILNNYENYNKTLCTQEQIACQEFKTDSGVSFFKDPSKTASLCVYRSASENDGKNTSGWFMDGVGTCSNDGDLCKSNTDCGEENICQNIGNTPCYANYFTGNGEYKLWSNASEAYAGFVGSCATNYNGCTELVDPQDDNQKYYVLNNNDLFADTGSCDGKVSQKDGCVLFDMTENPNKFYDSVLTYENVKKNDFRLTPPVTTSTDAGDTNVLLKVDRNRQCGEWLSCRSSKTEVNKNTGISEEFCLDYKLCDTLDEKGECDSRGWLIEEKYNNSRLTEDVYVASKQNFADKDYSGYSLYNKFSINNYVYVLFSNHKDAYLAYEMSDKFFAGEFTNNGCFSVGSETKYDGDACGYDLGGRCYSQKCLYPIDNTFKNTVEPVVGIESQRQVIISKNTEAMLAQLEHGTCKSYPETESPFAVSTVWNSKLDDVDSSAKLTNDNISLDVKRYEYNNLKNNFSNAKVCQFDDNTQGDCSCDYIKVEYKSGQIDYWSSDSDNEIPEGICTGTGDIDGLPCSTDADCKVSGDSNSMGICNKQKSQGNYVGLKGLCLEYDLSRSISTYNKNDKTYQNFACMTWLPIQVSATSYDLYNTDLEAGYLPEKDYDAYPGGLSYCAESTSYGLGYYDSAVGTILSSIGKVSSVESLVEKNIGLDRNYNNIFDVGAEDIVKGGSLTEQSCATSNNNYARLLASNTNNSSNAFDSLYSTLQIWGWRNIGPNSRLIRFDKKYSNNEENGCFVSYAKNYDPKPIEISDKISVMFSFTDSLDQNNAGDSGSLLHPPRLWSSDYLKVSNDVNNSDYNYLMYSYIDTNTDFNYVETSALSPDMSDNDFVYSDKNVEKNINEKDLDSVYFVPLAFPEGAEGPNPSLFTKNFLVNFNYLNNTKNYLLSNVEAVGKDSVNTEWFEGNPYYYLVNVNTYDAKNFSYVLTRNKNSQDYCQGLLSYCDYKINKGKESYFSPEFKNYNEEKNEIYKRYVTLFYVPHASELGLNPFNFHQLEGLPDISSDPFSVACKKQVGKMENNWMAIGMDFNEDGEFLGYISRWCNGADDDDEGSKNAIRFAVFANLNDQCTQIVSVTNNPLRKFEDYNKAWTDRVWSGFNGDSPLFQHLQRQYNGGNDPAGLMPFGSLNGTVDYNSLKVESIGLLGKEAGNYTFPDIKLGVPYSCTGGSLFDNVESNYIFEPSNMRCAGLYYDSFYDTSAIEHKIMSPLNATVNNQTDTGMFVLNTLFKKFYTGWDFNSGNEIIRDNSGTDLGKTQIPKIFAVNPDKCLSSSSDGCSAAKEGFTLNGRNYTLDNYDEVPGPDEDKDRNGAIDPIIAEGSYKVYVQFFAYADDNRMPIKRVMLNWNDGTRLYDRLGAYKNRKPYCADNADVGRCTNKATWQEGDAQLTCKEDVECINSFGAGYKCDKSEVATSHFGDSERACLDTYFELSHTYYCDPDNDENKYTIEEIRSSNTQIFERNDEAREVATKLLAMKKADGSPFSNTDEVCVFKPAVQVLDNWGWCNGSCVRGYNIDANNVFTSIGSSQVGCYDNTSYYYNGVVDGKHPQCSSTLDSPNTDPWLNYKGAIIVIP
ncbi:MAG: hypothetical protein WC070_03795 [Candidatus Magasanikbacteria bacterium]